MPASSAMRASLTLSGQLPDQRSGTKVTARPDEQLAPNRPILSALPLYMAVRCCMEAVGASTNPSHHLFAPRPVDRRPKTAAILKHFGHSKARSDEIYVAWTRLHSPARFPSGLQHHPREQRRAAGNNIRKRNRFVPSASTS